MNRLNASTAAEKTEQRRLETNDRRARTRTLIQIGSLVNLAGLGETFEIELGDDLQLDTSAKTSAATLLGFLLDASKKLEQGDDENLFDAWHAAGVKALQVAAYKKIRR